MRFQYKLIILIVALVALILTPYFLWHDRMDAYFASESYQQWLISAKPYAWLIAIALIIGDLVLPIPTSPIMASLGVMYGTLLGGLIGAIGSVLAGITAYGVARLLGRRGIELLASEKELAEFRDFFDSWGTAGIIASRAFPVVPEVMTLLAGTAHMHFGRFVLALVVGSVPVGFLMAWVGEAAGQSSTLLLVMTLLPAGLWVVYLLIMGARQARKSAASVAETTEIISA
ncbi:VTT domain-containing protein [Singulisphaera sp. Ch08]|uniref:VTT domain-containing protein n=1 Tax=Singulisphaera sp. Ch08 TaxID=3120278 RepID=A0AAU7CNP1_9BACT